MEATVQPSSTGALKKKKEKEKETERALSLGSVLVV